MSVADHASMIQKEIGVFGETLTLRKTSAGTYSEVTRSYTGETTTTTDIVGFIAPYKLADIDGISIIRGDLEARISAQDLTALGVTVVVGDFIDREGKRYRVEAVDERGAGDVALLVIAHLRGTQ